MHWYSEKFVEDCVAESPETFLGRPYELVSKQYRIGGFVPDLVFLDENKSILIVEVQLNALDRTHLYKCLEYRDLMKIENPEKKCEVCLVCEKIPEKYLPILKTHDVSVFAYTREEIINNAIKNSQHSLSKHLLTTREIEPTESDLEKNWELQSYNWSEYDNLYDVFCFSIINLVECDLWEKVSSDRKYQEIFQEVRESLSHSTDFSKVVDPCNWRIDSMISKPTGWTPPHLEALTRIRKPKITISIFRTLKGNLSVRWNPVDSHSLEGSLDWVKPPNSEHYGYDRPENELIFIHDIDRIYVRSDSLEFRNAEFDRDSVETMMIGLIWALVKRLKEQLSGIVEIVETDHFVILTGETRGKNAFSQRQEVLGWKILSSKDYGISKSKKEIEKFTKDHNISEDGVLDILEKIETPWGERAISALAKALRERGHKITVRHLRPFLHNIENTENLRFWRIVNDGKS